MMGPQNAGMKPVMRLWVMWDCATLGADILRMGHGTPDVAP